MFYRQKVMLALLELSGGMLNRTDLQKLLFLLHQTTNQSSYDFVPHKYGPFSFIAYDDRRKLIEQDVLKDTDDFELKNETNSFITQLRSKDRVPIRNFAYRYSKLRGNELLHYVYTKYPQYTVRSQILDEVLTPEEYHTAYRYQMQDNQLKLFTIGYEGSSLDNYLNRLIRNNVKLIVDVRSNPISRKYGFSKTKLQEYLEKIDVSYCHLPELGIPSALRKDLSSKQSYQDLFETYATTILPKQPSALNHIKVLLEQHRRIALTCFEADYCMCHRHKITEVFATERTFNIPISHI